MKLPLLLLLLLAPPLVAESPQEEHFRMGEAALADELWEVAALHFSDLLQNNPLDPEAKSRAAIRLAEAWVRGGQPKQALDLLAESFLTKAPGFHFWRGQALAGTGQLSEALKELLLDTSFPVESAFTRSALLLSMNQPDQALGALHPLSVHLDPKISLRARLREVEILIDQKRFTEARAEMPLLAEIPEPQNAQATFLEARLLLAENKPADAAVHFSALLDQPTGQTLARHHAAAIGYADALAAQGDPAKAADSLLGFIQLNPDSPLLPVMFERLIGWLPAEPLPNHPILGRLEQWVPASSIPDNRKDLPSLIAAVVLVPTGEDASGAWPVAPPPDGLAPLAMFHYAIGLHRVQNPASKAKAKLLLERLELEYPRHPLASAALFQTARWLLEEGKGEQAFVLLDALRDTTADPIMMGEAAFLKARAAFQAGDNTDAIRLFDEAAKNLNGSAADSSRLNSAISRIREGGTMTIALTGPDGKPIENPILDADLELERALAATPATAARIAIEAFLTKYPKHPRVPEARLAAAEAALSTAPPDLSMARAQLDTIASEPAGPAAIPPARMALVRLRLTDLADDPTATATAARAFLETYPGDPSAPEISLTLGRALFHTEHFNDALLVLKQLAATDTDPARTQAAWLLAARSAALIATPQSREEALGLFDKAAAAKGTLGPIVMMEKARLMIDLNRLQEADDFLRKWFRSLPPADPLRIPAGLLFGEAAYGLGGKKPEALLDALAIYDELLKHPETKLPLVNRIQYLRGMTLEQLPKADDPTKKREAEALEAYYSVIENAGTPPAEWHFLERSGFRALEILEKAQRWPAALKLAKTIAALKGPRSEEAAIRARQIQLKNFIWED